MVAVVLLSATLSACAATTSRSASLDQAWRDYQHSQHGGETQARLRTRISVDFDDMPIRDVFSDIMRKAGVSSMYVNWVAFENVGVEPGMPISLRLTDVTAAKVLGVVLDLASATVEFEPVGYALIDDVVYVSSQREIEARTTEVRIYDIRDLLPPEPEPQKTKPSKPEAAKSDAQTAAGVDVGDKRSRSGGGQLFSGGDEPWSPREEAIEQLIDLMRALVDPSGCASFGGEVSRIREYQGLIHANVSRSAHGTIAELLHELRKPHRPGDTHPHVPQPATVSPSLTAALAAPISVSFDETPFGEAIETARNQAGIANLVVVWPTLANVGVTPETPITLDVHDMPARDVLDALTQQAALDATAYAACNNTVAVSTERELRHGSLAVLPHRLRAYDISDLVDADPTVRRARATGDQNALLEAVDGCVDEVLDLIRMTVGRLEDWEEFGGDTGFVTRFRETLVVRHSADAHRELVDLLHAYRHPHPYGVTPSSDRSPP